MELGFLGLGLLGSLMVAGRIAAELAPEAPGRALAPWALLHLILAALGVWVLGQPMDMRGTFLGS
jgi:hypothetical protein